MDDEVDNRIFLQILEELKNTGMTIDLYQKIAKNFYYIQHAPVSYLSILLKQFIDFNCKPIYVNEIKNFLKSNCPGLFLEYGKLFQSSKGVFEVFGLPPEHIQDYNFIIEKQKNEDETTKEYNNKGNSKRNLIERNIKRNAKKEASKRFKEKLEQKKERKRERNELDKLMRKQDL